MNITLSDICSGIADTLSWDFLPNQLLIDFKITSKHKILSQIKVNRMENCKSSLCEC